MSQVTLIVLCADIARLTLRTLLSIAGSRWHILKHLEGLQTIDLLYLIESQETRLNFERFCFKLWGVWKDRCALTHNDSSTRALMGYWTDQALENFQKAQRTILVNGTSLLARYATTYKSTNLQSLSIFVDAAYDDKWNAYATGVAIFDPGGKILAAGCRNISLPGSVMVAELQAILDGILFGRKHFTDTYRIFSDSIDAIHALQSGDSYKGYEAELINDIIKTTSNSSVIGFWYCNHTKSRAAHSLVRSAIISPTLATVWGMISLDT